MLSIFTYNNLVTFLNIKGYLFIKDDKNIIENRIEKYLLDGGFQKYEQYSFAEIYSKTTKKLVKFVVLNYNRKDRDKVFQRVMYQAKKIYEKNRLKRIKILCINENDKWEKDAIYGFGEANVHWACVELNYKKMIAYTCTGIWGYSTIARKFVMEVFGDSLDYITKPKIHAKDYE